MRGDLEDLGIREPRQDLAAALGVAGLQLSVDLTDLEQARDRRYRHIPCNVIRDARRPALPEGGDAVRGDRDPAVRATAGDLASP
jgi:hypothetical protein